MNYIESYSSNVRSAGAWKLFRATHSSIFIIKRAASPDLTPDWDGVIFVNYQLKNLYILSVLLLNLVF